MCISFVPLHITWLLLKHLRRRHYIDIHAISNITHFVIPYNMICWKREKRSKNPILTGELYFSTFLCPRHKMARGHLVFALSVLPSFRPSIPSKFVFSTPPTSLHGFEWNLAGVLHHKSRSACGEIIHIWQILAELWPLTVRIFTLFILSSQLLLHPCMDLNETWQGCCTTSLEVHVER